MLFHRVHHLAFRWLLLGAIAVIAAGTWLWNDQENTLQEAANQQANVARLLEIHTSHIIAAADSVLDRVLDEVRDHDIMGQGGDRRWPVFASFAEKLPVSGRLWLYRADGSAVMASHMRSSTNNATDREYFTAQRTPGVGLFIGETVVGKTTGKKVFNLSRRIDNADGSFGGVAMAVVDIDVFIQAVTDIKLGETAAYTLVRNDGAVIMRHPDAGATGNRFRLKVLDQATTQPEGTFIDTSPIDGVARQVSYRRHANLPLVVEVSLSQDEILTPWKRRAAALGIALVLILLIVGTLAVAARRATAREQSALSRMQTILDTVAEGICGIDSQGRIAFINPAGGRLLGYRENELIGESFHATVHHSRPDGSPCGLAECPVASLLSLDNEAIGTDQFWRKDGRGITVEYAATGVDDLDGQRGVVMAFRDITERQIAEEALRASEARFRDLLQHTPSVSVQGYGPDLITRYWNQASERLYGYRAEEAIGRSLMDLIIPDEMHEAVRSAIHGMFATGQPIPAGELLLKRKDGSRVAVFSSHAYVHVPGQGPEMFCIDIDLTERNLAEQRLRESKERLEAAASAGIVGVWDWDVLNDRMVWDKVVYRLYGLNEADRASPEATWASIIHPEDRAYTEAAAQAALRGEGNYEPEFRVVWPDGSIHHIQAKSRTTFDAQGKPLRMVGVVYDITERKNVEAMLAQGIAERTHALKLARDAAEAANVAKSAFLANMSHEMRTPLHQITGLAQIIHRDALTPRQTERLEMLEAATRRLTAIIDTILNLTKIEADQFDMAEEPFNPRELLDEVLAGVEAQASAKQLHLTSSIANVPVLLVGDKNLLKQALLNYVANAIRFTETGAVEIRLNLAAELGDFVLLRFEVEDSGPGIDPEHLSRLFSIFEQADNSSTRKFGGLGMGLAMTKKIAEIMGGEAGCDSQPGVGSTFWFTVRLKKANPSS